MGRNREVAMNVEFMNPGADYMIESILGFQTSEVTSFWSEPLFWFYPQLDKEHFLSLDLNGRKCYIDKTFRSLYEEVWHTIDDKIVIYSQYWSACRKQIEEALSDAFETDVTNLFNDLKCCVSMNPVSPRFLKEHGFEVFYLNSEKGAIGLSIREIIHFIWFHVWNELFQDSYDEYEIPSLKWIFSEMVVESIIKDPRLASIDPYFPRENGGCIYPFFFDMKVNGELVLEIIDRMYDEMDIRTFMNSGFEYCKVHEADIRKHMEESDGI